MLIFFRMVCIFWRDKLLLLIFIKSHSDMLWRDISQVSEEFSHLGVELTDGLLLSHGIRYEF